MKKEAILHRQVCDYLRKQYPNVLFTSEASGLRLTMGQAVQMKKLRSRNGFPDLMIFEPRGKYHGLFIELKADGVKILNNSDYFINKHISEQADVIYDLKSKLYYAEFAVGFNQAKELIDSYMRSAEIG